MHVEITVVGLFLRTIKRCLVDSGACTVSAKSVLVDTERVVITYCRGSCTQIGCRTAE